MKTGHLFIFICGIVFGLGLSLIYAGATRETIPPEPWRESLCTLEYRETSTEPQKLQFTF